MTPNERARQILEDCTGDRESCLHWLHTIELAIAEAEEEEREACAKIANDIAEQKWLTPSVNGSTTEGNVASLIATKIRERNKL